MEWKTELTAHLDAARILLFLISPDLLNAPFYIQGLQQALAERKYVLPVLLRSTSLQGTTLAGMQCLPRNGRPILPHQDRSEAFTEIVDEIKWLLWTSFASSPLPYLPRPALPEGKQPAESTLQSASDFIATLVEPKLAQFHARARRHRRVWERSLFITVSMSGVTCLLTLADLLLQEMGTPQAWQALFAWLLFLAASASLVCVLLLLFSRLYELQRWQYYQQRQAELGTEKRMYETKRGIYALVSNSRQILIERVFQIIQHVGEGTRSADETEEYRLQE
jgi:hypothetical protein